MTRDDGSPMQTNLASTLLLASTLVAQAEPQIEWRTDLEAATKAAQQAGKPLFLVFR